MHQTTTATPEQFIAGLTNVGPDRSKLPKNSAYAYLRVHREARSYAGEANCRSGRRDVTAYSPSRGASMPTHVMVRHGPSWSDPAHEHELGITTGPEFDRLFSWQMPAL